MTDRGYGKSSLGGAIARGAVWMLSLRLVVRSLGLVSTLILARLLTPLDFGVYGLAMSVYALVELLRAFGFGTALIQNQQATSAHYDTAWTMHFLFSMLGALVLYFLAPHAASLLRESQLEEVVRFMCIVLVVDAFRNIGIIDFQKHMAFDREFRLQVAMKISSFLVTVALAITLNNYWAMLWGVLVSGVVMVLLSYTMQSYRPRFSLAHWRELISFTAWLQVNNVANYLNRHVENFLVSRMSGVAAVGSLRMAKDSGQVLGEIAQPINQAAYPGYARVNSDPARVKTVYLGVMGLLMLVGFLVSVGIVSIAHLMIPVLLGEKWLHIIPLAQGLALVVLLRVWLGNSNNVLIALGRPRWATFIVLCRLFLYVCLLLLMVPEFGLMGVVYSGFLSLCVVLILIFAVMKRQVGLTVANVLGLVTRPAIAALLMYLALDAVFPRGGDEQGLTAQTLEMGLSVLLGVLVYLATIALLWFVAGRPEGAETDLLRMIERKYGVLGFLMPGNRE